jgi:polyvinyl alcohol dehydrogenase (cytochrome)
MSRIVSLAILVGLVSSPAVAQDGAALYARYCSMCHDGGIVRAPSRKTLAALTPERIVAALENGVMRLQGADRTGDERKAIAVFLTGKPLGALVPVPTPACASSAAATVASESSWNGWSATPANDRYQRQPGIAAADVPRLKLKWAFGFPGDASAAVQPSIVGDRVLVGSSAGRVYSLSLATGCAYWTFDADIQVRTAIVTGPPKAGAAPAAFFADVAGNVYSVDAATGTLRWKIKADEHPIARVTATPKLVEGRLYVALSSLEELAGADPAYPCCTFRGSLVALDAETGRTIWRTYTIADAPAPTKKNAAGTQLYAPSGAAVWGSPTIDAAHRRIYVGTGDSYSEPAAATSDAILALDLDSGAVKWAHQFTSGDAYNLACGGAAAANCPSTAGPDHDFGAPPILVTLPSGEQRLLASQKSGVVHAIDPESGRVLWSTRIGPGGVLGGVEWGAASDGRAVYVALSGVTLKAASGTGPIIMGQTALDPAAGGGLFTLRVSDGTRLWTAPPAVCANRPNCSPAQSAPVTAIDGAIFSGSVDGHLRAYAAADGHVIWDYDTAREFDTVNHVKAAGGSIDVGGAAVAGGVVVTTSGYPVFGGRPGNVLLVFSVDGR